MSENLVLKVDEIEKIARGGGIETMPLVIPKTRPNAKFTTGISTFPPGQGAAMHKHNCDEQVTLLAGRAACEIDGVTTELGPHDTTYIAAGVEHRFYNIGDEPFTILWIYGSDHVTRTFAGTGKEVPHLTEADRIAT